MPTPDHPRSYELRFLGGGPDIYLSEGGTFESESALLEHMEEVHEQLDDPGLRELGRAEVHVYRGKPPDPETGRGAVTIGKMDAAHIFLDGEVNEDELDG